jgi:large subunit ribosomal protein L7/L12
MADIKKLKDELSKLTVLEAAELVEMLEEEWGVSAAAPVAVAAVAAAGADAGGAAEEKSEYDVVIKDVGPKKIEVIKAIRAITSLGLKDAKDMAEAAGSKVLEAVGKDAAEEAKKQLEEAGAVIELA